MQYLNNLFSKRFRKISLFISIFSCSKSEFESKMSNGEDNYSQIRIMVHRLTNTLNDKNNKSNNLFNCPSNYDADLSHGINIDGAIFPTALDKNHKTTTKNTNPEFTSKSFTTSASKSFDSEMSTYIRGSIESCCFEAYVNDSKISKRHKNNNEVTFYQLSTYLGSKKSVLTDEKLSEDAKKDLQNSGFQGFIGKYGTHYISGCLNVSSFFAYVNIVSDSNFSSDKISTEITAKLDTFFKAKGSYKSNEEVNSFSKNYKLIPFVNCKGIKFCPDDNTLDGVLRAYSEYCKLSQGENNIFPAVYICTPYSALIQSACMSIEKITEEISLQQENIVYNKVLDLLSSFSNESYEEAARILLILSHFKYFNNFLDKVKDNAYESNLLDGLETIVQTNKISNEDKQKSKNIASKIKQILKKTESILSENETEATQEVSEAIMEKRSLISNLKSDFIKKVKDNRKKDYALYTELYTQASDLNVQYEFILELKNYKEGQKNIADIAWEYDNLGAIKFLAENDINPEGRSGFEKFIMVSDARKRYYTPEYGERVSAIVIGNVGSGKTTLFNHLCNTDREEGQGGDSKTKDLAAVTVSYGDYPNFELTDTMGVNGTTRIFEDRFFLYNGLTSKSYSAIIIVIRFDCRNQNYMTEYKEIILPLSKYDGKVTILVTYFDLAQNRLRMQKEITENFRSFHIDADIIFFSNTELTSFASKRYLANLIYKSVSKDKPEKFDIKKEDYFSASKLYGKDSSMLVLLKKFVEEGLKIVEEYVSMFKYAASSNMFDFANASQFLFVRFQKEIKGNFVYKIDRITKKTIEILEKKGLIHEYFDKSLDMNLSELEDYTFRIELEKKSIEIRDKLRKSVDGLIETNTNFITRFMQLFKKCPNCPLIWMRAEGCDGETWCGQRPQNERDEIAYKMGTDPYGSSVKETDSSDYWLMRVVIKNGIRQLEKLTGAIVPQKTSGPVYKSKEQAVPRGCNNKFIWRNASTPEPEYIKQFFNVEDINNIAHMIIGDMSNDPEDKKEGNSQKNTNKLDSIKNEFSNRIKAKEDILKNTMKNFTGFNNIN